MHRDEWDDEDEEPASAGAPLTTKEKDLLRYYYYIHNGIDTRSDSIIFIRLNLQIFRESVDNRQLLDYMYVRLNLHMFTYLVPLKAFPALKRTILPT
jgi:hypothetical protein